MRAESDSQIARDYGLTHSSVRRHRLTHLADKLRLLEQAEARAAISHNTLTVIGFASDLYSRAITLADRADAFFTQVEGRGQVSSRTVQAAASSLRELRASIGLLADLVVDQPAPEAAERVNAELDAAITEALGKLTMPELPAPRVRIEPAEVLEAEVVPAPGPID